MPRAAVLAFCLLAPLALGGCLSRRAEPPPAQAAIPEDRPADFTLAVTVYSPVSAKIAGALPRALRPARYVVEPDGTLRAAPTTPAPAARAAFPPRARTLTPRQMDQIWRLLRDTALLEPTNPARVEDPGAVELSPDRTTATLYIAFADRRTSLRLLLDRGSEDALSAERIADHLAALAFLN
jgi:hypothetical protein